MMEQARERGEHAATFWPISSLLILRVTRLKVAERMMARLSSLPAPLLVIALQNSSKSISPEPMQVEWRYVRGE